MLMLAQHRNGVSRLSILHRIKPKVLNFFIKLEKSLTNVDEVLGMCAIPLTNKKKMKIKFKDLRVKDIKINVLSICHLLYTIDFF